MIEAVLLTVGVILGLLTIFLLAFAGEGTKGITEPYKTKSGKTHTARKDRENFIV